MLSDIPTKPMNSSVARGGNRNQGVAIVAAAGGKTPTASVSPPVSFAQNCTEYRTAISITAVFKGNIQRMLL